MCAVSAISDYGARSKIVWDQEAHGAFQKMLDAAKEFDEAVDRPDCPSEDKKEWMDANNFHY